MTRTVFQFDGYLLDSNEQRFQKDGEDILLPPKVFAVLRVLLENHGQLVTNDELMEAIWKETFVEDGNIRYCVYSLRKVFGDGYIETVVKRGYRFNSNVSSYTADEFIRKHTDPKVYESTIRPAGQRAGLMAWAISAGVLLLLGTAAFFGFAYFQVSVGTDAQTQLKTITVLPFTIIGSSENEKVTVQKGVTNAVIFKLDKLRSLRVTKSEQIQHLFEKEFDVLEVGRSFVSDEVLTGAYRVDGNVVRINTVLLDVSDGSTLLTDTFTVKESNQIDLERSIALRIARTFDLRITRLKDDLRIKDVPLSDESRQNYLTAQQIIREFDFGRQQEAVGLMKKISAEHPNWALGQAKYAEALVLTHGGIGCEKARASALRAIELDSSLAESHLVIGVCHVLSMEWSDAEQAFKTAIAFDPNLDRGYIEYGAMLDFQRRFAEAEINLMKAIDLQPFTPYNNAIVCQHYYFDLRTSEALDYCNKAEKIDPGFWLTPKLKQWIYVHQKRWDEVLNLHFGDLSQDQIMNNPYARALSAGDEKQYWEVNLQVRLDAAAKRFSPAALATAYLKTGDKEKALQFLEIAAEDQRYELYRINPDPIYQPLRKEPRFIELIEKMGLGQ